MFSDDDFYIADEPSGFPCEVCLEPATEFSVPSQIWNVVVRKGEPEGTHREYLCVVCFHKAAAAHIAALQARVAELEAAREWRDIATAPKDGKRVILFGTVLSYTCGRSSRGKPLGSPGVVVGYWDTDRWGSGVYEIVPTRWMPMPQPPEPPTEDK